MCATRSTGARLLDERRPLPTTLSKAMVRSPTGFCLEGLPVICWCCCCWCCALLTVSVMPLTCAWTFADDGHVVPDGVTIIYFQPQRPSKRARQQVPSADSPQQPHEQDAGAYTGSPPPVIGSCRLPMTRCRPVNTALCPALRCKGRTRRRIMRRAQPVPLMQDKGALHWACVVSTAKNRIACLHRW